jgi:peptidoglycan/xylan/chitin deacetylase (PgdA/CDA1 family)
MNLMMLLSQAYLTGAETYATTLSEELIMRGHKVYIISDTLTLPTSAHFYSAPLTNKSIISRIRLAIKLTRFVKEHEIQVIHSHSRASAWVGSAVSSLSGIPHIWTVHGRQHLHLSRHLIPATGDHIIAVCEALKIHLEKDLHIRPNKIEILRNPIKMTSPGISAAQKELNRVITIIGRLDGKKGDVAHHILEELVNVDSITEEIFVIGGLTVPDNFKRFEGRVRFIGQVSDVGEWMMKSSVIISAGRTAAESLMHCKPVVAVGEACSVGLVTAENLPLALATNFGDINENHYFDWKGLVNDIKLALAGRPIDHTVSENIAKEFSPERIVERIETLYQHHYVLKARYEVPVLCYHRVIADSDPKRGHGIWTTASQFEHHLQYLKQNSFHSIGFSQLESVNRLDRKERYVIITFDDGYADNYHLAFPLLLRYGFKAVIFPVTGIAENIWDTQLDQSQPKLPLLTKSQIREMHRAGIEFGSHTMTHPDLTAISEANTREEIGQSKAQMEQILGESINALAYPYGNYNDYVKKLAVEAGYRFGVTTDRGPVAMSDDYFAIRRMIIFPGTTTYRFSRKVHGDYGFRQVKREKS